MSAPIAAVMPMSSEPVAEPEGVAFGFKNSYVQLPERFYAPVSPTVVAAPRLIRVNEELARELQLDPERLRSAAGVQILAGNRIAEGSEPIATAYAGHQFGYFVPQLGDGRAILLGEVVGQDGLRYDVQLKGPGRTPFSRGGDGRAAVGPVLREYILSEAMAALGVPTTRALAAVATGEGVFRETVLPGAVLTRVARSHLRVGTFQYFAVRGDVEGLRTLTRYALERLYPERLYPEAAAAGQPGRALLLGVIRRQAQLIAQWMLLGFLHGVMNTDNMSISGETIDYGPCAFMEAYDPETVFSSIDRLGRYAFGNQPEAAHWNLTRLAEALLPLLSMEQKSGEQGSEAAALEMATEALAGFGAQFEAAYGAGLRRKIGLETEREGDAALVEDLLARMTANQVDFTLFFRRLCDAAEGPAGDAAVGALFTEPGAYDAWAAAWRGRSGQESTTSAPERAARMRRVNPAFIPRNHRVEAVIAAAVQQGDFAPFAELVEVVAMPFEDRPELERYMAPARVEERVLQTFCGT